MKTAFKLVFAFLLLMLFLPAIIGFVDMFCWFYVERMCSSINWTEGRACTAVVFGGTAFMITTACAMT